MTFMSTKCWKAVGQELVLRLPPKSYPLVWQQHPHLIFRKYPLQFQPASSDGSDSRIIYFCGHEDWSGGDQLESFSRLYGAEQEKHLD